MACSVKEVFNINRARVEFVIELSIYSDVVHNIGYRI